MKIGKTIAELAAQLEHNRHAKRDYIAATPLMQVTPDEHDIRLSLFIGCRCSSAVTVNRASRSPNDCR